MIRLKIGLLVIGAMVAFWGVQEYRVSAGTSTEPIALELRFAEMGHDPEQNHVLIGEHIADYDGMVYEYEGDTNRVTHAYYPIVSESHPFFADLNELEEKYSNVNDAPEDEWPVLDSFRVLVKSSRFGRVDDLPDGLTWEDNLQGLVINLVDRMDSEERTMIQESFPNLDMDQLLIIEDGRKPTSVTQSVGMIAGGAFMSLLSCGWFLVGGRDGFFA